jgi:hypothetical protein
LVRERFNNEWSNSESDGDLIEEHRQAILSALAGTKIASDPEIQKKLFDIKVRLVLSPEAGEFMKSYSPVTTAKAP